MKKIKLTSSAVFRTEAALENPNHGWLEFILTDNEPNDNSQGIPSEAFDSLIDSGLYMPIKVAEGGVRPDHSGAMPLGPIIELDRNEDQVPGRAVIWKEERPEAYRILKEMQANGDPIDISWELAYTEATQDEDGVTWLQDPVLKAATIVGNPAYSGRTPVTAIASEYPESEAGLEKAAKWTTKYINDLPDSAFLYIEEGGEKDEEGKTTPRSNRHLPYKDTDGNVDCSHLKNATSRATQTDLPNDIQSKLKQKAQSLYNEHCGGQAFNSTEDDMEEVEKLKQEVSELKEYISELESTKEELEGSTEELRSKNEELASYKEQREEEDRELELLASRLDVLDEAGIELSDEELEEKKEVFLELSEEAFSSMVDMMKEVRSSAASVQNQVPDLSGDVEPDDRISVVREGLKDLDLQEYGDGN